ncbi:MAG: hypothetical protein KJ069_16075 [Anaerolineae bacterium]|nr:hypothetical protein [Anaerolineae bacterium]
MNNNLLLSYLSELGHGNWSHFRQALEYLADDEDDLYRTVKARQLSMLGHIEFAFEGDLRWAVCEPTIAWLSREDRITGVLGGGRSPQLLAALKQSCADLDCRYEQLPQAEGPDVVLLTAPSNDVGEQLAHRVGIQHQPDSATRLAEVVPDVHAYLNNPELCPPEPMPQGFKSERYDWQRLRWAETATTDEPGFYRFSHYRREYRLKMDDVVRKTPPYIGIFAWLHYKNQIVFQYEAATQTLRGPASATLPPLLGRAAVLCSGHLPRFEPQNSTHIYQEIPPAVANHLLYKLHQGKAE